MEIRKLLALIAISTTYVVSAGVPKEKLDLMTSSFYTGCMSGIMAVIENGYYQNGGEDSVKAFGKMKATCKKHVKAYEKAMKNEKVFTAPKR